MAGYLNQNGNSIGSLLRFIQEQKSQSPIIPQGSEVGSPIRDVVQQPLKGSEGQGTSKVVSLRPEGTLTPSGNPIEQGTPQSSRIGPISIGGDYGGGPAPFDAPNSVVAANEPGKGFTIPSASRTAGDVLNRTGSASPQSPSLGTTIKASTPTTRSGVEVAQTSRGQEVGNYGLTKDRKNSDITSSNVQEELGRKLRSTSETEADLAAQEKQYQEDLLAYNKSETPEQFKESLRQEDLRIPLTAEKKMAQQADTRRIMAIIKAKEAANPNYLYEEYGLPTPTPTPSPMRGGQVQGASTSASNGGGTTNSQIRSVAPRVAPAPIQSKNQYSTPVPIRSVAAPAQSKPAPSKPAAKAPSLGTVLGGGALQGLKKLFGWK